MGEGKFFEAPTGRPEKKEVKEYAEFGLPAVRHYEIENGAASITEYEREGTNWRKMLEDQENDFVEIGGPSLFCGKSEIINFGEYVDRTICTNVSDDFELKNQEGQIVEAKDYVDKIMKATDLDFEDGEVGAVFARNFRIEESMRKRPKPMAGMMDRENNEYIRKVVREARRVLAENGLVVWLNLERADMVSFLSGGFELIFYQKREYSSGTIRYQAVFRKDEKKYED